MSAGKGDKYRLVDRKKYEENWNKIDWSSKENHGENEGQCRREVNYPALISESDHIRIVSEPTFDFSESTEDENK